MLTKIRYFVEIYQNELFFILCMLLIGTIGFGIGRLSFQGQGSGVEELHVQSTPISAQEVVQAIQGARVVEEEPQEPTDIVGNKNSRIFHLSTCSGARSMAERNKIYFSSIKEAVSAGYRPAANCPGL